MRVQATTITIKGWGQAAQGIQPDRVGTEFLRQADYHAANWEAEVELSE